MSLTWKEVKEKIEAIGIQDDDAINSIHILTVDLVFPDDIKTNLKKTLVLESDPALGYDIESEWANQ